MRRGESSGEAATMMCISTTAPAPTPFRLRAICVALMLACVLGAWLLVAAAPAIATTSGPPSVEAETAEALQTSATFKAKISRNGFDTTCQVQYVSEAGFLQSEWAGAASVPCVPEGLGSGSGEVVASAKATGLARETVYDYRFVATNKRGSSDSLVNTLETYRIHSFLLQDLNGSGAAESQAGGHPYELVTTVAFSHTSEFSRCAEPEGCHGKNAAGESASFQFGEELEFPYFTALDTKDIKVNLPAGLVGNPEATPKCTRYGVAGGGCPADTQVGVLELWTDFPLYNYNYAAAFGSEPIEREPVGEHGGYDEPIYNLEPSGPYPAEFGTFIAAQAPAWITFHLRTGSDYGVSADALNIVSTAVPNFVRVRVWGVPFDPRHCSGECASEVAAAKIATKPLLTNPTACAGPLTGSAEADTWQEKGAFVKTSTEVETGTEKKGFTGCGQLKFEPTLDAQPTSTVADSPSGLEVKLKVPQHEACQEEGGEAQCETAEAELKDTKITLPAGLTLNPAAGSGLAACSPAQIELHGPEPAKCPEAAKIGTVEVNSPLIDHPLPGAVYVATPYENPFGSLLAIYVAVDDPQTGVVIKLAGHVEANPATGQLTTSFEETPQLPFEEFKLDFFQGERAVLRTPATCGSYESKSVLTPWSAPESGPPATWPSPFKITSAPGGAPCPSTAAQEPNAPSFTAGPEAPVADSFSPFVLHLQREDDSQELKAIDTVLPQGMTAKLAGVARCSEAAIAAAEHMSGREEQASPSCPAGSEVGTIEVGAGAGADPYYVQGHIYLAGPYEGAPRSLAIVTPAVAGPYDLGTVVVRAALYIDPYTSQVTVKSDPIPTILDGIPLDVRSIAVKIGRPGFTLNPTSCEKMAVTGEAISVLGQSAKLSDPFKVGNCTSLPFKPTLKAETHAYHTRKKGSYLKVTVTSKLGQANLAKVHVTLPKILPADLETLKQACTEAQFAANPSGCPKAAFVGTVVAHTPLLSEPLIGPAILVSHGGLAFPDLALVLQSEGITIIQEGATNISKGFTSSSFNAIPDVPVNSVELMLPESAKPVLGGNGGNFCYRTVTKRVKAKVGGRTVYRTRQVRRRLSLTMPATLTSHDDAVLQQLTPVAVRGCGGRRSSHSASRRHKR